VKDLELKMPRDIELRSFSKTTTTIDGNIGIVAIPRSSRQMRVGRIRREESVEKLFFLSTPNAIIKKYYLYYSNTISIDINIQLRKRGQTGTVAIYFLISYLLKNVFYF
jgi:hypothetical protein